MHCGYENLRKTSETRAERKTDAKYQFFGRVHTSGNLENCAWQSLSAGQYTNSAKRLVLSQKETYMHDNEILNLDAAAKLVHATAETLLQHIRRGDLKAARVGKHFVITYVSLINFVDSLAASQSMERRGKHPQSDEANADQGKLGHGRTSPVFVQLPVSGMHSAVKKPKGRRRQLPVLPPLDP